MSPLESFLIELQTHNEFGELKVKLKSSRPTIQPYNGDNIEQMKIQSGRQEGFDMCLATLKINIGD